MSANKIRNEELANMVKAMNEEDMILVLANIPARLRLKSLLTDFDKYDQYIKTVQGAIAVLQLEV